MGVPEGDAARGTSALHLRAGDLWQAEAVGDEARQHFLPGERARDEIAEIERADCLARQAGIPDRGVRGASCQHLNVGVGVPAKSRGADACNVYVSHGLASPFSRLRSSVFSTLHLWFTVHIGQRFGV